MTEIKYVAEGKKGNEEQVQNIAIALLLAKQIINGKKDDDVVLEDLTVGGFKSIITQIKIVQLEDVIKEIAGKKQQHSAIDMKQKLMHLHQQQPTQPTSSIMPINFELHEDDHMQSNEQTVDAQCMQFIEDLRKIDSTSTICPVCLDEEEHSQMSQNCYMRLSNCLLSDRSPRIEGRRVFDEGDLILTDDSMAYQCHTCGHFMHQTCGKSITSCPLCRQRCNVVLPILFNGEYAPDVHLNVLS